MIKKEKEILKATKNSGFGNGDGVNTFIKDLYANYDIRGVQKQNGDWAINTTFVGDNTGYVFSIDNVNSKGQIKYTSTNVSGWSSTTIKFRAHTTSA